jgi:hypothetical protein
MAFQILADAAKTNIDILETIQLLAQGRNELFFQEKYFFVYEFSGSNCSTTIT